jgi:biopolymer transport protein ExbB
MLSNLFLGMSLLGAEWVLYLLVLLSVVSVSVIFERLSFYRGSSKGLADFRRKIREAAAAGRWSEAQKLAEARAQGQGSAPDLEAGLAAALLAHHTGGKAGGTEVLTEVAQDQVVRAKLSWDKNLAVLATIGNNAPFVGLFGTVLGIIKAFHDLSKQSAQGVTGVTAGVSEALVATAVGILVAIPAVVAFNFFQRRVRAAMSEAEATKSFLIGQIAGQSSGK